MAQRRVRTIFLSGPMGAGKSTVAVALGRHLGRPVMLGLGGPALHAAMGRVVDESMGPRYMSVAGSLDDPRDIFGGLVRLWNASR